MLRPRAMAAIVILIVLASGCSLQRRDARPSATPNKPSKVGKGLLNALESAAPSAQPGAGGGGGGGAQTALLTVTIFDQNDLTPAGIPVQIEGSDPHTVLSDANGQVQIFEPGRYKLRIIEGCHERIQVTSGGYADVGVVEDQPKSGSIPVEWRHRYAPSQPVHSDTSGDWKVGKPVTLKFEVRDKCEEQSVPGATYPTYEFHPGSNLKVDGTPKLVADSEGYGSVTVRCTAPGEPELFVTDKDNPSDSLDLIAAAIGYGGVPRCSQ